MPTNKLPIRNKEVDGEVLVSQFCKNTLYNSLASALHLFKDKDKFTLVLESPLVSSGVGLFLEADMRRAIFSEGFKLPVREVIKVAEIKGMKLWASLDLTRDETEAMKDVFRDLKNFNTVKKDLSPGEILTNFMKGQVILNTSIEDDTHLMRKKETDDDIFQAKELPSVLVSLTTRLASSDPNPNPNPNPEPDASSGCSIS